jgi:arylsulfatase A-like enzyme
MAELDRLGLTENTLVIFSSDNGPVLDDGYYDDAVEKLGNHKPAGALRGGKYSLFEAGTRVPFMVYWKGKIQPQVSDALVCQLDFMASIAALTGQKLGKGFDSQNTLPAFLGKSKKARTELVIEAQGRTALRSGNWVYIPEYKGKERNKTGNELANIPGGGLFNIKEDIGQKNNLVQTNQKLAKKLAKRHKKITGR